MLHLRTAARADYPELAKLYRESVLCIARYRYNPVQVRNWASWTDDLDEFSERLDRSYCILAEDGEGIAAFGTLDLHPDGAPPNHLGLLYCLERVSGRAEPSQRATVEGKSCTSALLDALHAEARRRGSTYIATEASKFSRRFFERRGYRVVEPETIERDGVTFDRFRMRIDLDAL
jgi:putative acetyltransferase